MGKRRIAIEKIENHNYKRVTFSKRRKGLFKKASEFYSMSDIQVAMVVFSPAGRLYVFGHVDDLIDNFFPEVVSRHESTSGGAQEPENGPGPEFPDCGFPRDHLDVGRCKNLRLLKRLNGDLEILKDSVLDHARKMRREDNEQWRQFINGVWGNLV